MSGVRDTASEECDFDDCHEEAVRSVKTVLCVKRYCLSHARFVSMVEREWDDAEAEMLEQF